MGIILGIIGIFLLLMLCVMWILNVSPEVAFFISLAICIIMIIYNSFKEKNSDSNYKSNRNNKKEYLKNIYKEATEENEDDEERKNIMIEEFVDFFEKEKISSDLNIDEVKSLLNDNGYTMISSLENEALIDAIKKYRGINFKEDNISDKEKNELVKDFINIFRKENVLEEDLGTHKVDTILKNNGFPMNTLVEAIALDLAIKKYKKEYIIPLNKDKIKKEISSILKDLEEENNIKYFYHSDIVNAKKVLQEHNYDMKDLDNIAIFEEIVNQFNIDNKENKIKKENPKKKDLKDSDKNMVEMKNNVKIAKELRNRVERIESFEEQLGITLENISFHIDDNYFYLNINGEIIKNSDECNINGLYVCAVVYNNDDEILYTGNTWISNFIGYDTFNMEFNTNEYDANTIKRIRIFVKE